MVITPHIVVQGAEHAARFYRDAFGARELTRIPTPGGRLMSVQLQIGDSRLHMADEFPELGVLAPPSIGGTAVVFSLEVEEAEAVFAQAIVSGAEVRQPLQEMFWGDLHGQLEDPFGHRWNVAQHVRDVPPRGDRRGRGAGLRLTCAIGSGGRSGLRVSELCLGTMTFGEEWGLSGAQIHASRCPGVFVDQSAKPVAAVELIGRVRTAKA